MHTWSWRTLRRYAHSLRFPVGLYDTKKIHQMVKYYIYTIKIQISVTSNNAWYLNYFSCHINLKYRVLTIPVLFFWSWFNIMIISRNFSMMHYDICYHSLMIAEHIMLKLTMAACIGWWALNVWNTSVSECQYLWSWSVTLEWLL